MIPDKNIDLALQQAFQDLLESLPFAVQWIKALISMF